MRKLLRVIEVAAWAGLFALAALLLGLRYWVFPDIERYRGDIVAAISRGVGLEVKVGGIEARWQGLRPHIYLSDVRIYDAQGREALVLPSVENVLAWRSILRGDLQLHSLVVDRPRLAVRRDAAGTLYVAGMKLSSGQGEGGFADWVLRQEDIVIQNAEIEWLDEKRGAPPLALSELTLRLRNSGNRHSIGLSGRPPAALGSNLDLRAELVGKGGRVYAEFGYTNLAAWRPWIDYPLDLRQGQGALRLWVNLDDGAVAQATADVALADVVAQLGTGLPPLELASLQGRLQGRLGANDYEFTGRNLALTAVRGERMQPTDIQIGWRPQAGSAEEHGVLSAKLLELAPLARLAGSLPMSERLRKLLAEAAPGGEVSDLRLEWHGPYTEPQRYSAKARFSNLTVREWNDIGLAGISGAVEASEAKGRLSIASRKAELDLPRIFPEPRIAFDTLRGEIEWERHDTALAVRLASVEFENQHLSGSASGSYSRAAGTGPGRIDLAAQLKRIDGKHAASYLPGPHIMGKARDWVVAAVVDAQASNVQLRLRGDLRDFPFYDPEKGEFLVTARIQKGVLAYANGWPRIHDIDGQLRFERDAMEITGRSGTMLGAKLANVRATIPHLGRPDRRLLIDGHAEGPTSEFLKFIASSPVQRMTGGMTAAMSAAGAGRLALKIELPLAGVAQPKVAGAYEFADNSLTLDPRLPPLERAGGKISFTESGFALHEVRAAAFGGAVEIEGGKRPGGDIHINAKGEATVAGLKALVDHPWLEHLSGATSYAAVVDVRNGMTRIGIDSSLRGIAAALPPPFDKAASEALPLRVDVVPFRSGAADRIAVSLGRLAAVELRRAKQDDSMVVQRTGIALFPVAGQRVRLPERPGSLVYGAVPALDFDRWRPLLSGSGSGNTAQFDLRFGMLDAYGKRLQKLTVRGTADSAGWSASLGGESIAGELAFRRQGAGLLTARLTQVNIPADLPDKKAQAAHRPSDLPALDLIAERLTFRGNQLGRVELAGSRSGTGWRIEKLAFTNADAAFRATGWWGGGAQSGSELDFELDATDAGRFLGRVGYPDLVKGGKARLAGALAWQGQPTSLDYPTLSGKLQLNAQDGQFLEIEPGIGKLISLMSLQALPKRVALDFRDVFSKGFQFDRIEANAEVVQGVMAVKEFRMRGSAAEVAMSGEVDIGKETQNMRVRVVPSLGDSTSTAVAIVNPVAGVAAAIAQRVLKNPLGQIFAYEYSVTGSWSEPRIERVAVPATEVAPPQ